MARRVRPTFRKLPKDVYDALGKPTKNMTSSGALRKLKRMGVRPVTQLTDVRKMARSASQKSGVPIRVTIDMMGKRYADGTCGVRKRDNKVVTHIHPIVQYYPRQYVKDVIGHELDHAKVMRKK